ncbi:helix-turn-helix domain-containing protein [Pseudohongiella sp.]|uniref:HTH araC/xylS-type domain-containing protein n=1 Tax=marine sediment metagenome TaxID=412755 RepID=A0A0F9WHF1_9ZZZZ|nr:helix-turn-helix domain-containing protein [Pseudohongiella sp.]HDZ08525.1 helix-turn-helix domain-containing protein [Pseudohongiella sp.]HEA61737.1 helix-turn-helix domain-containing protein [Pseudohongiella sp.]
MHNVAILVHDKIALFELGCAVELFALPRPDLKDWYQCEVVAFSTAPLVATGGISLAVKPVTTLADYTMIIVPSWDTSGKPVPAPISSELVSAFKAGKRILSFCSGAFLLAGLGLLDDRKATTHWRYAEQLKALYPLIRYEDDVLYVYDGNIGCSAGSAAAIDLGMEVIRGDYGYRVANHVARRLVISAHRQGGQSQFVETPMPETPGQFAEALDWAVTNLSSPISINDFARKARMSRRTFDRRFKRTFGLSPKEWITTQRLDAARQLLESSRHDMEKVAERSGFGNAAILRHHFRQAIGVSPKRYREQFSRP